MGLFRTAAKIGIAKRVFTEVKRQIDQRQGGSTSGRGRPSRGTAGRSTPRSSGRRRR